MAATLVLDTIADSALDRDIENPHRRVRTGIIKNIPVNTSTPDYAVLEKALAASGMPAMGDLMPGYSNMFLSHIRIIPAAYKTCRVLLTYEENTWPVATAYVLRDRSYLAQRQTEFLPGTKQVIEVAFKGTRTISTVDENGNPISAAVDEVIARDKVAMNLLLPMRQINATAIVFGDVPDDIQDLIGKVNNATWRGKDKGYWLITELETDVTRYKGYFTYSVTAMTKVNEDWSEYGVLVNHLTGRYAPIKQSDVDDLVADPYSYGITAPADSGIVKVCPYEEADYNGILGFS